MSTVDVTRESLPHVVAAEPRAPRIGARSTPALVWRRLRADRWAMAGLAAIVLVVAVAIAAPLVVRLAGAAPPDLQSPGALDAFGLPTGPSSRHLLGVDPLGRDVLSRVVYCLRVSLEVAFLATGLAVVVGVLVGVLAGYRRGWVDTLLSRLMDFQLAFPILLLGIGLASACSLGRGCLGGLVQPGLTVVVFVIALASWPYVGRIARGEALSLREQPFVEAARSLGASDMRVVLEDVMPNLAAPVVAYSMLIVPTNILLEAALSYLGVGVQPPQASLGQMISDATATFDTAWWYMLFPGLALLVVVLAFNVVGGALQEALDPRGRR